MMSCVQGDCWSCGALKVRRMAVSQCEVGRVLATSPRNSVISVTVLADLARFSGKSLPRDLQRPEGDFIPKSTCTSLTDNGAAT
jgi:hypothetical protein